MSVVDYKASGPGHSRRRKYLKRQKTIQLRHRGLNPQSMMQVEQTCYGLRPALLNRFL